MTANDIGAPLVLLADDEPSIRETVSFILEMEGFRVATACDGVEALEAVRRLRPAVVLLDAMMPGKDGFEICRIIRASSELDGVRVVMLTALGQRADRERALLAGVDAYVRKPFDEDELISLLRHLSLPPGA